MRRAFSIVELLVVTIIIALLALIAIPAFNGIIADSERALAEEALQTAVRTARAAALRSAGDEDTALVFHYMLTPNGGRTSMVVCRRVAMLEDGSGTNAPFLREVFVPVPDVDPIQLPAGWMVRGYAKAGAITTGSGWYDGPARYPPTERNWVFPETDFYDIDVDDDGQRRQTFALRFQAGTGVLAVPGDEMLVLSPRPSIAGRNGVPDHLRVDEAENDVRVVRAVLAEPLGRRRELLGDISGDTILTRAVSQIALYNERELAAALGVRVDRRTACLYENGNEPRYVSGVNPRMINGWIEGDTNFDGLVRISTADAEPDSPLARVYAIDRYTAYLRQLEVLQ